MPDKTKLSVGYGANIQTISVELPPSEPRPWDSVDEMTVVGTPLPRIDGPLKASGEARYTHDITLEGLLHAAVLRSPWPCAVVKRIDVTPATKQPGVGAAIALVEVGDKLIFAGQDVAAVAASRPELARAALASIIVEYEPAPFVVATRDAMRDGSPQVHDAAVEERRTGADEPGAAEAQGKLQGNVRPGRSQKRGDAKRALNKAPVRFEATYTTQCHTHSALETHGLVVQWFGKKTVTVWASTQSIFGVRDEFAALYGLEPSKVHVITNFMGGGFGSKFGANASGTALAKIAGDLARAADKPVKLMLERGEEHLCTGNRPDSIQLVKLGATDKGKLTAIHVQAHGSAGVGTGAGVGRNAASVYTKVPDVLVESADVFTHAGPAVAFRAPGHPQGAFAMESALDELARQLGMDPIDLRLAHDNHPVRRWQLELGRERFNWDARRKAAADMRARSTRIRKGVGCAVSIWGDFGGTEARVTIEISRDGRVVVKNGVQDIGGGIGTIMAQVTAEVLRRPVETIEIQIGDSKLGPGVGSGGSKTTSSITPAVRNAAELAKAELAELATTALAATSTKHLRWTAEGVSVGRQTMSWADLCKRIEGEAIVAVGFRGRNAAAHPKSFPGFETPEIAGVQFAEVEIDTWTGEVRCTELLAVHDCGRVMNELTLRSQINGGIILGIGYALMEERVMDPSLGVMLNANLEQYKACGVKDVPDISIVLTEVISGNNSTGAYGIGEPATIPTAAAIANAVGDALGVHVRSLPITPAKILDALEQQRRASQEGAK
ncbi:xanthine dehydrogenase family protein molybdopterin-binding subunit [Enhygromyxa salina]|uniref:Xanthine dehydrogenase molybdenum-binding subunit n=1 Tax=Enhygromyxa salina TaxID=215803 RepID=A0A2S9YXJ7_9BACT|nr:xanthine dehydrogenase family protein molybdopterin-binding subunit [Enhygromyxa salina]PRQ09804.1 Xanthine dehydrogenase molybdenum-binding subunit [Enhygromyxa salina]